MYVVGVTGEGDRAGLFLFGNENRGWGRAGAGALDKFEPLGQNKGRWFVFPPFGVAPTGEYPSAVTYNGRTYICGGYGYNLVLDEHHRLWRQGIRPPEEVPDISGAAGTGTLAYFTWFDELTNERSPLSKALEIGSGTPRTWNNLPQFPPDDVYANNDVITTDHPLGAGVYPATVRFPYGGRIRQCRPGDRIRPANVSSPFGMIADTNCIATNIAPAPAPTQPVFIAETVTPDQPVGTRVVVLPVTRATHLELWLAIAGDLPRLAMRLPIGTTSIVESKGIADLGEAFITQFQRFPRCSMNAVYHDRQIMAGDSENPDTVYLSALFQPERFEGLSFRTRDGKAITGLLSTRDFCMVFTRSSAYLLQGYTDNDYTLTPVDQSIGAVAHNCNTVIHGNPYVWSEKGPYMYNGGWHALSPENRWKPPVNAAGMIATDDPYFNTYIVSQAYRAAVAQNEPYNTWRQTGAGDGDYSSGAPPVLTIPPSLAEISKYYAVLDYNLVQPETGGVMAPARLSWDAGRGMIVPAEAPPDTLELNTETFMKFLRNRYGSGNLYQLYSLREFDLNGFESYSALNWDNGDPAFVVGGMLLPEATIQLDLVPEEDSEIITPFDYLGDGGGYLMEQKQIKRVWYYMRMESGTVQLYVAPGPGYWGTRIYPVTAAPLVDTVTFAAGDYRTAPESPHADVIMPILPDFLSGRGMWVRVKGKKMFFVGYGVETIWGSEVAHAPLP